MQTEHWDNWLATTHRVELEAPELGRSEGSRSSKKAGNSGGEAKLWYATCVKQEFCRAYSKSQPRGRHRRAGEAKKEKEKEKRGAARFIWGD